MPAKTFKWSCRNCKKSGTFMSRVTPSSPGHAATGRDAELNQTAMASHYLRVIDCKIPGVTYEEVKTRRRSRRR